MPYINGPHTLAQLYLQQMNSGPEGGKCKEAKDILPLEEKCEWLMNQSSRANCQLLNLKARVKQQSVVLKAKLQMVEAQETHSELGKTGMREDDLRRPSAKPIMNSCIVQRNGYVVQKQK